MRVYVRAQRARSTEFNFEFVLLNNPINIVMLAFFHFLVRNFEKILNFDIFWEKPLLNK